MEENIKFETYTLAKEKGYEKPKLSFWIRDEAGHFDPGPRVSQTELQKWLREDHKIRVFPEQKTAGDFGFKIYVQNPEVEKRAGVPWIRISYFTHHFPTYEDALEAGIIEGLKLIEKN